ncbi:MAG TPA: hypothetical protein VEX86_07915 [Longimicrobium sp.]|nr:hypothetical protein [Longimicrobium sp.]
MNKLTLNLDSLQVDSFGTSTAAVGERGTVQGRALQAPNASKVSCGGWTDPCLCDPIHPSPVC